MKRSIIRRSTMTASLVLASSLVLTGCFPGGGNGDDSGGASGDSRIKIAMLAPPSSGLSPYSDDVTKLSRWNVIESLIFLDEESAVQPLLATDWEQIDDYTWDFTIREGVKFHDGTELTAASVVNSFEKAKAADPGPRVLNGFEMTTEAVDDSTVRIVTATPDPVLLERLSNPQMAIFAESAYQQDGTVSAVGTGTGAFVLKDGGGTSTATLDRFDDYWGGAATAAGIDATYVPDGAARGAALRTGTADIVEAVPVSQAVLLDEALLHELPSSRTNSLYFNNESGVFADQAMRAAARAALDPEAVIESSYEGQADAAEGIFGPAIAWAAGLRGDVESSVDPADPNGATITLATYTDRAELPEVAVLVEQQLEEAGFIVEQDVREYANFEPAALNGEFDAMIVSRSTRLETGDPVSYLTSDFTCGGTGFTFAQVCDPEVDKLIQEAAIASGDERQEAVMAVEAALLQADRIAPMLHERVILGEVAGVTGTVRDPFERRLITNETAVSE